MTYQLNVIDKASALSAYKAKHRNDVRYIHPHQTPNPELEFATQKQYKKPEIRVDKIFKIDLTQMIRNNATENATEAEMENLYLM